MSVLHRELNPDTVTHLSTNQARRTLTSLMEANCANHYARPPERRREMVCLNGCKTSWRIYDLKECFLKNISTYLQHCFVSAQVQAWILRSARWRPTRLSVVFLLRSLHHVYHITRLLGTSYTLTVQLRSVHRARIRILRIFFIFII